MSDSPEAKPRVYIGLQPQTLLVVFTAVNLLNYYDRGALASCLERIEDDYHLDNLMGGLLAGAYMAGYSIASPVMAHLANRHEPLKLMALGLGIWVFATAFSGLSLEYYTLLTARAFTGVGEASFLCLAPPFIEKFAPPAKRARWLSIFFTAIPVGMGIGYAVPGGILSLISGQWGWRIVFISEACMMIPFVIFCMRVKADHLTFNAKKEVSVTKSLLENNPDPDVSRSEAATGNPPADDETEPLVDKLLVLARTPIYLLVVAAYTAQTFVTGAFAVVGPKYIEEGMGYSEGDAGAIFGGITITVGIVGTGFGGWILDYRRKQDPKNQDRSLVEANKLCFIFSVLAVPAGLFAFVLEPVHRLFTFLLLATAEFMIFACIPPVNSAIMWSVPFKYNPIAIAMSVVGTHAFGDASSPSIVGALQDKLDNWNLTMSLATLWLVWPILLFAPAIYLSKRRLKRNRELQSTETGASGYNALVSDSEISDPDMLYDSTPVDRSRESSVNA